MLLRRPAARRAAPRLLRGLSANAAAVSSDSPVSGGSKRYRQHVNPLAAAYREPIELPDWSASFADASLPIHLDIGCVGWLWLNAISCTSSV